MKQMKKLILLPLLVMLSLSSYSQTDTTKITVLDTAKVTIPTRVARLVYQDLLRYDGLKLIDKQKDSIILFKDNQIDLFKERWNVDIVEKDGKILKLRLNFK